ncbi:hypothetical protein Athai_02370 [Actinocatenispora thailandica]|uniref:DUF3887 domain-containing protein n=1 Tax=Actinocatenispora thailandica TaxID=227318 RepID=A0A7R7HVC4_9ACTN|nr:DUF3887 domain-containing protein [Actinocatenispora thailandica]BCJ32734.1 hypothetical protein Athai_02370 [Actinocatenispora thailandica]
MIEGKAPGRCRQCGKVLAVRRSKGRSRLYCDATCRSAARRERDSVKEKLTGHGRQGTVDSGEHDPLAAVIAAHDTLRAAEQRLHRAVRAARSAGETWEVIGETLGITRQAAYQRFGRADERSGTGAAPLPDAADRSVRLLVDLSEHRWSAVTRRFSPRMAGAIDATKLAAVWAEVTDTIGRYEGIGTTLVRRIGRHTVVDVAVRCEAGDATLRVAYDDGGAIAGLFLLPIAQN